MSITEQIMDELDGFIDRAGGLSRETMAHAPTITTLLAHGDPEQAFLVLEGIRSRNTNRDIAAAFAHLGAPGYQGNTEDRLNQFGMEHNDTTPPSSRTVRRWSMSGQRLLANEIVAGSGLEPPTAHLDVLRREDSNLVILPTIYHMHGYTMSDPVIIVVGRETHAIQAFPTESMEQSGSHTFQPESAIEVDVGFPVHIQLVWLGEVQPTVVIRTINFPTTIIEMCTLTPGASGLALYAHGDEIDSLAEVAAQIGHQLAADAEEHS
uniref:hypothetical protein n=1 Tax=Gordonia sp. B7-2 TaxID=3420932 RepID=UPI003D8FE5A9